jgi:sec-independent protein translocase protein TatA
VKPGLFQILVIVLIVLVFFGRGRIGDMLGDLGKGIKSFRKGLDEDAAEAPLIDGQGREMQAEAATDKTAG